MAVIVIGTLIGLFVGIKLILKDPKLFGFFLNLFWLFCSGLIGATIAFFIVFITTNNLPSHDVANDRVYLVSLTDDNDNLQGALFLGTGGISTSDKYKYRTLDARGGAVTNFIDQRYAPVHEDEQEKPYYLTYHQEFDTSWHNLIGIAGLKEKYLLEFHIPKDTLPKVYKISQ
jgi:hypothetical protein